MKSAHSIELLCRALKVSRSGFYEWRGRPRPIKPAYPELKEAIEAHFKASRKTYGHRRIRKCLEESQIPVGLKLVNRLMKEMGLEATPWKPSPYSLLKEAQESKVCAHVLEREFKPLAPNRVWTSDITYIWTQSGWVYLAVILDLFSRRIIGWSVSEQPDTHLVQAALAQALATRHYVRGLLLFHSDQGCQYTSTAFQEALRERGILGSMSRRGQCWDNAPTESLFRTFKRETGIRKLNLKGLREVESLAFDWIETWYNLRRKHTFTGYISPAEYEMRRAA
jgi:putative transposase